jgi:hypothetical protein
VASFAVNCARHSNVGNSVREQAGKDMNNRIAVIHKKFTAGKTAKEFYYGTYGL